MTAQAAREAASHPQPSSYDPPGSSSDPWGPYIKEASKRFDVPERWIREVMRQESGGRATARSPVGAMGLMQVMPGTYAELRARYGFGDDPYHPWNSIMAGSAYVREMYELYGSPGFLAAYNAGPRRLEDYLWASKGLPAETRNYVARIGPRIIDAHPNRRAAPEVYAAAEIPLNIPAGPRRGDTSTMLALREQRNAVDPGIRVASLPPGPITRMEPIPDGSTYASAPVQVASLSNVVSRMEPIPDGSTYAPTNVVARMAPIPDGSTYTPTNVVSRMEPIPDGSTYANTPAPPPPAPAPVMMASLPVPPPMAAPAPSMAGSSLAAAAPRGSASGSAAAALASLRANASPVYETQRGPAPRPTSEPVLAEAPPRQTGFRLVSSAQAGTLSNLRTPQAGTGGGIATPVAMSSATGQWAVQVGAFASANLARGASEQARDQAGLRAGRAMVEPVASGRATLYRARVSGLSREAANAACEKLRTRGACIIVSPDAQ
ncbi:lytic transglycosylase domain-containing protein [Roseomonas haemaphysalidis]|uniref:lytic transglycosylase domain-containing protein n=1 Tax=Roseomonas haemaphysalidis TaxID=2768162 RepID=UPI001F1F5ED8|nr:lytic transglycosylase domain-containing protein [Roseomonas haemaphysalidis]